jgi:hypothetical protein
MGKERDRLIRRLGGRPLADENSSDERLVQAYFDYYRRAGRLPPEIAALRERRKRARESD